MNLDFLAKKVLTYSRNAVKLRRSLELGIMIIDKSLETTYVGQTGALILLAKVSTNYFTHYVT